MSDYDWRENLQWVPRIDVPESFSAWSRLTAYIERLEAERDALLAEHEAIGDWLHNTNYDAWEVDIAHDKAERVKSG